MNSALAELRSLVWLAPFLMLFPAPEAAAADYLDMHVHTAGIDNPWDRDVALKKASGMPEEVFERSGTLLPAERCD